MGATEVSPFQIRKSGKILGTLAGIVFLSFALAGQAVAQSWTKLAPTGALPLVRSFTSSVLNPTSNRMIVFGGQNGAGFFGVAPKLNDTWVLSNADGLGGTPNWTQLFPTGGPPSGRGEHSAVYDEANNKMIVFAGNPNISFCFGTANDTWVLSNADGTEATPPAWVQLFPTGGPPSKRGNHSLGYDPATNRMIVFGGNDACGPVMNDVWVLSNANGTEVIPPAWTQLSPIGGPSPAFHTAVYDAVNNRLIAALRAVSPGTGYDMWVLSNANGLGGTPAWTQLAPTGIPTSTEGRGVYDSATNRLIMFGGSVTATGLNSNEVWALENANGLAGAPNWIQLNPTGGPPPARWQGHTAVLNNSSNRMTVFGGSSNITATAFNDAWILTGVNGSTGGTCVAAPSGLVSWWDGDAISGTVASDIQGTNHGTLMNGTATAPGKVGSAFSFTGNNPNILLQNSVEVSHSPSLQFTPSTPFSIDGWINVSSFTPGEVESIVAKWGAAAPQFGYGLIVNLNRRLQFSLDRFGGTRDSVVGATVIAPNTWYLFAATYDGTTMRIYVNGVLEGSVARSVSVGGSTASSSPLFIGRTVLEFGEFTGLIDELEVFNRALTGAEIQTLFNAGSAGKCKIHANHPPTLTAINNTPTFVEGVGASQGAAVTLFSGANSDTVEPGQLLDQLTLTLTNVGSGTGEQLSLDGGVTFIDLTAGTGKAVGTIGGSPISADVSLAGGTATVVVNTSAPGLTPASMNVLINGILYRSTSSNPAANGLTRVATIIALRDSGSPTPPNSNINTSLAIASTVAVVGVNDPPVAVNDSTGIAEDSVLSLVGPGVLANDSDPEGSSLTANLVGTTGNGALALNADGSLSYTPNVNFNGSDSFTYRANDGALNSNTATMTINVTAVNDAPVLFTTFPVLTAGFSGVPTAGNTVASIVNGNIADPDLPVAPQSIAVTGKSVSGLIGDFEFRTNVGAPWIAFGPVSTVSSLLLGPTDKIRFNSVSGAGTASFTFRAWDQTTGVSGSKVSTAVTGGTSAFSVAFDTTSTTIIVPAIPSITAITNDTGVSSNDFLTSDNTLMASGILSAALTPGQVVQVSNDGGVSWVIASTQPVGAGTTWSHVDPMVHPDGTFTYRARVFDNISGAQLSVSAAQAVTIDTVAPVSLMLPDMTPISDTGIASADNITHIRKPVFEGVSGSVEANAVVELFVDGISMGTVTASATGAWTFSAANYPASLAGKINPSGFLDGAYSITARQKDMAGNLGAASAALNITIDTTIISPVIVSPTPGFVSTITPTLSGTSEPNAIVEVFDTDGITLLGSTISDGAGNWSVTISSPPLTQGAHTLKVRQTDIAGNISIFTSVAITVDTFAPAAPLTPDLAAASDTGVSSTDNISSDATPTFQGAPGSVEPNAVVEVFADGNSLGTIFADALGGWLFTPTLALSDGVHAISARQTDAAGNVGAQSPALNVIVDTFIPATPTVVSQTTSNTSPVITGTFDALDHAGGFTVIINGITYTLGVDAALTNVGNNWSLDLVVAGQILSPGTYNVVATATDTAGNVSTDTTTGELTIGVASVPALPLPGGATASITAPAGSVIVNAGSGPAIGGPAGVIFPFGTISYSVTSPVGGSVTTDIIFSAPVPVPLLLWKFDGLIYTPIPSALWAVTGPNTVSITLTDGGPFDLDGAANGIIVDPIAVGADVAAPIIAPPAPMVVTATGVQTAVALTPPVVTDLSAVTITSNAPPTFPLGLTTVIWTATDASGNFATATQTVTVNAPNVALLTPAQIALLTPAQLALLTPAQIAALTPLQLAAMIPAQLVVLTASLTPAQIAALTPLQLAMLLPALTPTQIVALTPVQLATLTPVQVAAIIGGLTPAQAGLLTPAQLAVVTPAQIAALSPPVAAIVNALLGGAQQEVDSEDDDDEEEHHDGKKDKKSKKDKKHDEDKDD